MSEHLKQASADFDDRSASQDFQTLRRTHLFDHVRAAESLKKRAFERHLIDGGYFDVVAEPMLRETAKGFEQPIRVRSSQSIDTVIIEIDGVAEEFIGEPVSDGLRFFIPEQSSVTTATMSSPLIPGLEVSVELGPVRRWELSLVHHSHFDIGYTDLQGQVILEQLSYLDHALELAEADLHNSSASAFKWSVESLWVFTQWMSRRPAQTVERMMHLVKEGRIELAALPFNMHTEACSTEELHGLLQGALEMEKIYGVSLPVAYQTDVPGCVSGTVDALSDAGVRYLAVAHNWAGRSVPYLGDGIDLPRLFWWESPAGKRLMVWMTTTAQGIAYQEGAYLGLSDSLASTEDALGLFLHCEQTRGFPFGEDMFGFAIGDDGLNRDPYPWAEMHLRVMGRVGDNSPPNRRLAEVVAQWNEKWAYPKLEITLTEDYFKKMEQLHGNELEVVVGDWNDWWADGIGSAARHVQMNRNAQNRIAQATTVAAMSPLASSQVFNHRLSTAQEDIALFDEHTWGASNPWTFGVTGMDTGNDQWHWKAGKAIHAEQETTLLEQEALLSFADHHQGLDGSCIWVINTSASQRSGVVEAFLPEYLVHTSASISLVDSAGNEMVFREKNQTNAIHREAGRFLQFFMRDIPATSARRITVVEVADKVRKVDHAGLLDHAPSSKTTWSLENSYLRVVVNNKTGAIASIYDKNLGLEMVSESSPFGFNAYIHDQYATRGNFNHQSGFTTDFGPHLTLLSSRTASGHVSFEGAGEDGVCSWLRFRTTTTGIEHVTTTLTLWKDTGFLDIANAVAKKYTSSKESGFFAFPFAASQAEVRYEVTGGVAGSDLPKVRGGAEYMHCVRDWVVLRSEGRAFVLTTPDAPLVQIGDIALPFAPFPGTLMSKEPGTIFSWIHNNIWDTNFPSGQELDMEFRYRVAASGVESFDDGVIWGAEISDSLTKPLLAVAGKGHGGETSTANSLVTLSDSKVRLLSVTKLSESKIRVSMQSLSEFSCEVKVTLRSPITSAKRTTLVGKWLQDLALRGKDTVSIEIGPLGTLAIEFEF